MTVSPIVFKGRPVTTGSACVPTISINGLPTSAFPVKLRRSRLSNRFTPPLQIRLSRKPGKTALVTEGRAIFQQIYKII
ncbi:hypothetical protein l11_05860 [Neisseria weaveri LMG 5135]|nr:hypothetical protein l11_05860 [Neisseria weaveri LMG 5135]